MTPQHTAEELVCVAPSGELEVWREAVFWDGNRNRHRVWRLFFENDEWMHVPRELEWMPEFYGREVLGEL